MSKINLLVFMPLFFPADGVVERISVLNELRIRTVAWKNSPLETFPLDYESRWEFVRFFGDESNKGIGLPLRDVEVWALSEGYSHLLFFDQDTDFSSDSIEMIISYIDSLSAVKQVAQYCFISTLPQDCSNKRQDFLVNSGSVFPLGVVSEIGYHSDQFFVDGVDYDFCIRSRLAGYELLSVPISSIDHNSLQGAESFSLFGLVDLSFKRVSKWRCKSILWSYTKLIIMFNVKLKSADFMFILKCGVRQLLSCLLSVFRGYK